MSQADFRRRLKVLMLRPENQVCVADLLDFGDFNSTEATSANVPSAEEMIASSIEMLCRGIPVLTRTLVTRGRLTQEGGAGWIRRVWMGWGECTYDLVV